MQRTPHPAGPTLGVQPMRVLEHARDRREHGAQHRSRAVDPLDTLQVRGDDRRRGRAPPRLGSGQFGERALDRVERAVPGRRSSRRGRAQRREGGQ